MQKKPWDERLVRDALASEATPHPALRERVKFAMKEQSTVKQKPKRYIRQGLVAAAVTIILSISAFAAYQLLSPGEAAGRLNYPAIAAAFEGGDATVINETVTSGGFKVSLLGIVSGSGLESVTPDVDRAQTYAVVAVERADGQPMPDRKNDNFYVSNPLYISPYVKGHAPWQININTLHGSYSERVIDGVLYRLIACDTVEIFADRGVYLGISSGSLPNSEAFRYDASAGTIAPNPSFDGVSIVFDLPIDPSKADGGAAERAIDAINNPQAHMSDKALADEAKRAQQFASEIAWIETLSPSDGEIVADSVQVLTPDAGGNVAYSYNGSYLPVNLDDLFDAGQTGYVIVPVWSSDDTHYQLTFLHRDEAGVITGATVRVPLDAYPGN